MRIYIVLLAGLGRRKTRKTKFLMVQGYMHPHMDTTLQPPHGRGTFKVYRHSTSNFTASKRGQSFREIVAPEYVGDYGMNDSPTPRKKKKEKNEAGLGGK